ncbi:MAG: sodium-dependent transporter [Firmicutes bacterium]|nr:sodium-dependent transporter [Bacillota bacterium]
MRAPAPPRSQPTFSGSYGFLASAVGAAVGLGNIWSFPYKLAAHGGAAFLLAYLTLALALGLPLLHLELRTGRRTACPPPAAYRMLHRRAAPVGWAAVLASFLMLAFYCVLGGLVLRYAVGFALELPGGSGFFGLSGAEFFAARQRQPLLLLLWYAVFLALSCALVGQGVRRGIERFSCVAMPALIVLLIALAAFVAVQPGAAAGWDMLLRPSSALTPAVWRAAAVQLFFSLSLGQGCLLTYGSYLPPAAPLPRLSLLIVLCDTLVAALAAAVVLPACAAFGAAADAGPALLFSAMHAVFAAAPWGDALGLLFYTLVTLAALTSAVSLLEVCTAALTAAAPLSRRAACLLTAGALTLPAAPVLADAYLPLPWLELISFAAEGVLMPGASAALVLLTLRQKWRG